MRERLNTIIGWFWALLGLGILVNLVDPEFWRILRLVAMVVTFAAFGYFVWAWLRLESTTDRAQQERHRRQRLHAIQVGVPAMIVMSLRAEFWLRLGSELAYLAAVLLIVTILVRSFALKRQSSDRK